MFVYYITLTRFFFSFFLLQLNFTHLQVEFSTAQLFLVLHLYFHLIAPLFREVILVYTAYFNKSSSTMMANKSFHGIRLNVLYGRNQKCSLTMRSSIFWRIVIMFALSVQELIL